VGYGQNEQDRRDAMYLTKDGKLHAIDFYDKNNISLSQVNNELLQAKEDLIVTYNYDLNNEILRLKQGDTIIGDIPIPINAVVNHAEVIKDSAILKLTVKV
jgi:tRNA A58 N-methylase Trm61